MQKAVGITVAALTLAATQAAVAADIGARPYGAPAPAYRTAPAMMAIYNWSGFYAGGNIGYSWGKAETDVTVPGFTVLAPATGVAPTFPLIFREARFPNRSSQAG